MELKHILLLLLLVPMVCAQGGQNGNAASSYEDGRIKMMEALMENIRYKAEFTIGVLGSMDEYEGLPDYVDVLEKDLENLEGYVDEGDSPGFSAYVRNTYTSHMREAQQAIVDARKGVQQNERSRLRNRYQELKQNYTANNDASMERFANAKVKSYEAALEKAQGRADDLEGKGVDTSALNELIGSAQDEIVAPLGEALKGAENGTEIRNALREHCLFNGCYSGNNFHFWLKFEIEKLDAILDYITPSAEDAGLADEVSSAQDDLNEARGLVDSIGGGSYSEGNGKEAVGRIRSASTTLKDILHRMRLNA